MATPLIEAFTPAEKEAVQKFKDEHLEAALNEAAGDQYEVLSLEVWGVPLGQRTADPRVDVVLLHFLKANNLVFADARNQLVKTLRWRKEFNPQAAATEKHDPVYDSVGYVSGRDKKGRDVTYNLYGGLNNEKVFGDLNKFLRWRVGLMERAIETGCNFTTTHQIVQVHDYANTSLFSMSAITRRASKATIDLFSQNYPELLASKFFVNVPRVLAWVFGAISNFLSKETVEKFIVLGDARDLKKWIDVDELPERYGGDAKFVPQLANPSSSKTVVEAAQSKDGEIGEVQGKVERMDINDAGRDETVS